MAYLKVKTLTPSTDERNLSEQDVKSVQHIWELVKQDLKGAGIDLFIKFFTNYPEDQKYFKSFANVPLSELRDNKRLLAHATNVLYALTAMIDSIEDSEVLTEMITKMAENHFRRKIPLPKFYNLGLVIIDHMCDKMGDEVMTQQVVDAWKKTYLIIYNIVQETMQRKEAEKKESS